MSEARALGAKRRLQEAVLGHSSGAKAERLYHQCSRDASVEAVDEPELNVWYRKDQLSKEAPKRAPEVARDAEGYPVEARWRLEILKNGQVKDLDTHQLFRQVKRKEGVRLVPIIPKMDWKSEAGLEASRFLLDFVGERGQYMLVEDDETRTPMTSKEWKQKCIGNTFKPIIFCGQCNQTSSSTCINSLRKGTGVGCGCLDQMQRWKDNFDKFKTIVEKDNTMRLVTTKDEWIVQCTGFDFKPMIECTICKNTCSTTTIQKVQQRGRIGCACVIHLQRWVYNYDRFNGLLEPKKLKLITTRGEWVSQCTGVEFKPMIQCTLCGEICKSTTIGSIKHGSGIGCACVIHLQRWVDNYDRFIDFMHPKNLKLLTTREEWKSRCTGSDFRPTIQCTICDQICIGTSIHSIQMGRRVGCACVPELQRWVDNYDRFQDILKPKNLKLLTTRDDWKSQCTGNEFKPTIQCTICNQTCTGTTIGSITKGFRIDCSCRHKTEGKLFKWLKQTFADVRHNMHKLKNPDTGRYNLSVDFDVPSRMLAFELDGAQHFDPSIFPGDNSDGPKRDLEKEKQLLAKGYQLIRVLQKDVWLNKNGWENYLLMEIERWRLRHDQGLPAEPARCPDAPEYLGGIYAELRAATV